MTPSVWRPRPIPQPVEERRTADPKTPTSKELAERERQRASLVEHAAATAPTTPGPVGLAPPCSRQGAIADPKRAEQFGTSMWALHDRWKALDAEGRRAQIETAVNQDLIPLGMPRYKVLSYPFGPGDPRSGEFSPSDWRLRISKRILESPELTAAQVKELGRTVYHEARHAEQWHLVARREAATQADRRSLMEKVAVSDNVARVAITAPLRPPSVGALASAGMRDAGGASTDTALAACADAMHAAYIENASVRNATISEVDAAWRDTSRGGDARRRAIYARYRALPEEADAFAAEDLYYATAFAL